MGLHKFQWGNRETGHVPGVPALCLHPPAKGGCVGGEAGERDTDVVVDDEHLLLVGGQLRGTPLEGHQHGVRRVLQANRGGSLKKGSGTVSRLDGDEIRPGHGLDVQC